MTISADDVKQLVQDEDADAVLVLIEGRAEVISQRETYSPRYRGALEIISRADLVERIGAEELSDHELAEQAAILDTTVAELGG
jgi:hypothetical protein